MAGQPEARVRGGRHAPPHQLHPGRDGLARYLVLYPEPVRWQPRSRLIRVTAQVQAGARSADLSYEIYVWPDEFASEADFLAQALERVRGGMEYKKNHRGDQQLRVLRVGFIEDEGRAAQGPSSEGDAAGR